MYPLRTLIIVAAATCLFGQEPYYGKRALWVVRDALADQIKLDKLVSTAASAGITDIFVQVRALGRSYYPGNTEPRAPFISEEYNPLELVIRKSEIYGIRVHAWINMFYIWSGAQKPVESNHPFNRFPQYLLSGHSLPEYGELKKSGIEGYFLDPQSDEIQKYLLNVLGEIVDTYLISGLHLDYFRYPDVEYSFTTQSRTNFRILHFFDPLKLYYHPEEYASRYGEAVYRQADKEYRQFLMDGLSQYLAEINKLVKEKNKSLELTVAVKPDPVEAKFRYFQDWQNWIKERQCDYVVLMNYRTEWNEFINVLNQLQNQPDRNKIIMGISTYNQGEEAVQKRLRAVQEAGFGGFALFSYNHLAGNKDYFYNLKLLDFRGGKNDF
jgi:uncharacterized lipoprotein YddW (UPF0748 family)